MKMTVEAKTSLPPTTAGARLGTAINTVHLERAVLIFTRQNQRKRRLADWRKHDGKHAI